MFFELPSKPGISQETAAEVWPQGESIQGTGPPQGKQFCLLDLHLTTASAQECEVGTGLSGPRVDDLGLRVDWTSLF